MAEMAWQQVERLRRDEAGRKLSKVGEMKVNCSSNKLLPSSIFTFSLGI